MWQWAGVPVNAILNRRWTQFINHANYKNNSNVMDCADVTKIPTPPSAKLYFPPDEHAPYKDNFAWEWQAIESHRWHCTTCWKCVFHVSWTLNINAQGANCLFAINAQIAICSSGEISSSVMVSFSFGLRIRPSTNINVDLDSLKVSLNCFSL